MPHTSRSRARLSLASKVRSGLRALLAASALLAAAMGHAATPEPVLREVTVLGLPEAESAPLREGLPLREGEALSPADVEALDNYLDAFAASRPLRRVSFVLLDEDPANPEVRVVLDYREPPRVTSVDIFGLVDLPMEELRAACTVSVGDVHDSAAVEADARAMEQALADAGKRGPRVTTQEFIAEDGSVAVGFLVEAGRPAVLRSTRFRGAGWWTAGRIRSYIKEPDSLGLSKGSELRARDVLEAGDIARELLKSSGHLLATSRVSKVENTRKGVKLEYEIDRGPRHRIDRVVVEAGTLQDPAFWEHIERRFRGNFLKARRADEIEAAIRRVTETHGHMGAEVELDYQLDPAREGRVDVVARVQEGPPSVMGDVQLRRAAGERGYGRSFYHRHVAPPVKDAILRKQVRVRQGEDLNRKVIQDAERRLWRLGTFEDVKVTTTPTEDPAVRDIKVDVTERRTAGMEFSLGWNDQVGAIVRGEFVETNVGGNADQFAVGGWIGIDGEPEDSEFGGNIAFLDRYSWLAEKLLGEEREGSILYSAHYDEIGYDEYSEARAGGRLRLSFLTGERYGPWSNSVTLRGEKVTFNRYRAPRRYAEDFDDYIATTVAYNITYDTRDRGDMDSTEGWLWDTGLEVGAADGPLVKLGTMAEYRRRLAKRWAWLSAGQVGLMPFEATDVGLGERYHAGGLGSIRGFDYRGIGPVDDINDEMHIGGATLATIQNEISWVISDNIQVPVFLDAAMLEEDVLGFGQPRVSTGFGLTAKLPGASNRRGFVYFAQQLSAEDTDDERSIHFGLRFGL